MMATFPRSLPLPGRSFFLFGPRGTGKTTWLRERLPRALWFDLVLDRDVFRLSRDPDALRREVEALAPGSWVVVDEVQRLPSLLGGVQDLIARRGRRYRFALTGSSARRLKRGGANLLPARVVNRRFFPLTADEMDFPDDVDEILRFGTLPAVRAEGARRARVELLEAYVENYLAQEVRIEAAVRSLDAFGRFLEVAALANGQATNLSGIARDAAVARPTVQGYFETLVDTLIGVWLPAWRARARIKERAHPKFFLFDTGVARALGGRLREPLERAERGPLLETYLLHELRAWMNLSGCGGELSHWRTPSGSEVDFVWRRARRAVGIEAKAADRWGSDSGRSLRDLIEAGVVGEGFGVYLGARELRDGAVRVLPLRAFLKNLYAGGVLG